jgi:type VI protein secretion system component VasF
MRLLAAARPALTKTQARVLVHAAMALVVDVGRLVHYDNSAENSAYSQACVRKLMEATVFGTGG